MRIARFEHGGSARLGVVDGDSIGDIAAADRELPDSLRGLLERRQYWWPRLQAAAAGAPRLPLDEVRLLAPLCDPANFLAVGLNYTDHIAEMGLAPPAAPRIFTKLRGSIAGPYESVTHPGFSDTLDYEGELALVIGTRCRDVPRARAREVIAGFLVVDDLSLRELVTPDLVVLGKGCDGFAVIGPWLTTADEVPDPHALAIRTWVNGELRQSSSTAHLLFDCDALIEWCTRGVTLYPGDIITTGSPGGVGHGHSPPRYLRPGDTVRIAIDGLGAIEHGIVAPGG